MRSGFLMMAVVAGLSVGAGTAHARDHHHQHGGHAQSRHAGHGGYQSGGHHGGGHYGGSHYGGGSYHGGSYHSSSHHGGYYGGHHGGHYGAYYGGHHGGHYGGWHGSLAFGFGFPAPYYGSYGYYGAAPYPAPYYGSYPSGPAYGYGADGSYDYGANPGPDGYADDEGEAESGAVDPTEIRPRRQQPNAGARLRLVITPADASVYVDGRMAGTARDVRSLPVAPGQHRVEAVRPGYEGLSRVVDVGSEEPAAVEMDLEPAR